jgi:hypothetical protein
MTDKNLYITIKDGKPVNYPISEENLKMFFPDLDPTNPPEGFARVVRAPIPVADGKQVVDGLSYELSNYYTELNKTLTYAEIYHLRELTFQEKMNMIQQYKRMNPHQANWIYDEESESLVPPVPKPERDNNDHVWVFPDEALGETEGKWVKRKDVVPMFNHEELSDIIENMKDLGLENDLSDETVQSIINSIKN